MRRNSNTFAGSVLEVDGDLLDGGLATGFLTQRSPHRSQLVDGFHHVHRHTDRPALICQRPRHRLPIHQEA